MVWVRMWLQVAFVVIAIGVLTHCSSTQVSGNGKLITRTRAISDVKQINIRGAYKIKIMQGSVSSLKITADSNIVPLVVTQINHHQLSIYNKKELQFTLKRPVFIEVVVRNLKYVTSSGANELILTRLNSPYLQLDANGSLQAQLLGQVDTLNLRIAGSGQVDASKLKVQEATIHLIGAGRVIMNAAHRLKAKIVGNGDITYLSRPKKMSQSITGSGTLGKKHRSEWC